jgi:hypothetical protein
MTRPIHLELFTDFFNKIDQKKTFTFRYGRTGQQRAGKQLPLEARGFNGIRSLGEKHQ